MRAFVLTLFLLNLHYSEAIFAASSAFTTVGRFLWNEQTSGAMSSGLLATADASLGESSDFDRL